MLGRLARIRPSTSTRPLRTLAAVAAFAAPLIGLGGARPAAAHTPHDHVSQVVTSPEFADDGVVLAVVQGRLLRSVDGGRAFGEVARGVGGRTVSRAGFSRSRPDVVYVGTSDGSVLRSEDRAASFSLAGAPEPGRRLSRIAVSPSSSEVVLVAGTLGGLFRSTDGGTSWTRVPGLGRLVALSYGGTRLFAVKAAGGVEYSDDDGASWSPVEGLDGHRVTALAGSPVSPELVLVGTERGQVFRSDDGGLSFTRTSASGLPDERVEAMGTTSDDAGAGTIWATASQGAFRSTDGGESFEAVGDGLTTDQQAERFNTAQFGDLALAEGPDGGAALFLAGFDGLFTYDRGQETWSEVQTFADHITGLAVSPTYHDDGTLVVNTYVKGVYVSRDRGASFEHSTDGLLQKGVGEGNKVLPVRRMHNVVFSPDYGNDRTIFTSTWDRFVMSRDAGRTWEQIQVSPPPADTVLRRFVIGVSPAFATDRTILLGSRQGNLYRSTEGGVEGSWSEVGEVDGAVRVVALSPEFSSSPDVYISTEEAVYKSTDGGATAEVLEGVPANALLAVSPGYGDDRTVFAGTRAGLLVSTDAGATWEEVDVMPGADTESVEAVAVSPSFAEDGLVLASLSGHGLFRSTDRGAAFEAVGESLVGDNLLVADFWSNPTSQPIQFSAGFAQDSTVYAYAQQRVVRSTDGGLTWEPLDLPSYTEFPISGTGEVAAATSDERAGSGGDVAPPAISWTTGIIGLAGLGALMLANQRTRRSGPPAAAGPSPPEPSERELV